MDVFQKLNMLKGKNHLTNYQLAKESGLPQSTISNIFARRSCPRIDSLEAICNVFGLTLAEFFLEDEQYVLLNESQRELFELWEALPKQKKKAVLYLIRLLVLNDCEN